MGSATAATTPADRPVSKDGEQFVVKPTTEPTTDRLRTRVELVSTVSRNAGCGRYRLLVA